MTPWKPGRLRHTFATEVRSRFGLEVAQVLLGHKRAGVTQAYAEATLTRAMEARGRWVEAQVRCTSQPEPMAGWLRRRIAGVSPGGANFLPTGSR
ncbi:site-specific integrase [bacterium]|nr:site-specific integrase [bacterium]